MSRIVCVVLLLCVAWLGGCARFEITAQADLESSVDIKGLTQGDISYQKGVQILRSKLLHSSVQIELAQKDIAHNVIVLYISAQLTREATSPSAQVFSPANISAFVDDKTLEILDYERLRKSNYDFIDILQDFNIPTPTPSVDTRMMHYNISPFFYMASSGFLYFPLIASPFMTENPSSIAYTKEKRGALKVLLMNTLRESTLSSAKAQGGFVVIVANGIKDSGTMIVEVRIVNEVHKFAFKLKKLR